MLRKALAAVGLMGIVFGTMGCVEQPTSLSSPTPSATPVATKKTKKIVLGDISREPLKKIDRFQPLADYLAANLGQFGIGTGEVKVAPDMEVMANMLQSGEIDLYFDSLYPAMIVSEKSGAKLLLRRWKKGKSQYHTILFARADSGLTSLDDLQGKMIGLEEPYSTSGYFLPMVYLLKAGLNPVEKKRETSALAEDQVGYIYTKEDENTIQWVVSGKLAAGAVDDRSFFRIPEETRTQLTILADTEKVGRQVVLIRSGIDRAQREAIATLLMEMDQTPEGETILEKFGETTKFDQLPPEAGWERMQELYQEFQNR